MLVLSRRRHASVVIGSDIEVKVLSIRRGAVKLGIDAPPEVPIRRNELQIDDRPRLPNGDAASPVASVDTVRGTGR
jgi:carbon storage regulator